MKQKHCLNCRRNFKSLHELCNYCMGKKKVAIVGTYFTDLDKALEHAKGKTIFDTGEGWVVVDKKQLSTALAIKQ